MMWDALDAEYIKFKAGILLATLCSTYALE